MWNKVALQTTCCNLRTMTRSGIFWLSVAARQRTVTAAHNQLYQLVDHAICQRAKTKTMEQAPLLLTISCTPFTKRGWAKHLTRLSYVEIYLLWEILLTVRISVSHLLALVRFNCRYKRDSERISILFSRWAALSRSLRGGCIAITFTFAV